MIKSKQAWPVAVFFIFYFILLQIVSDLQYYLEYGDDISGTLLYRVAVTPFSILAFLMFYFVSVPLLVGKRYLRFLLSVTVFLGFMEIYLHLLDGLISQLRFLPAASRANAQRNWQTPHFPRQSIWLTCTHLAALSGFGYFMNRGKEERNLQALREEHLNLQLNYLKTQLHPHFFFNTLNNIYSLALYRSEKTADMVEQLSQLMRYIIYEGSNAMVPLQKEIGFIQHYVALERLRHEDDTKVGFDCQVYSTGVELAPLLFMPLVENAFKHGFRDPGKKGWMEAILVVTHNELLFEVRNDRTASLAATERGIGLQNLRKRLELLYPGKHSLQLSEEQELFEARLILQWS